MSLRQERACMLCGVIRTQQQFLREGCPNCEAELSFAGEDTTNVIECTSPSFEGIVALGEAEQSWVAKWLRIDNFQPGLYAVKVSGKLPPDVVNDLEAKGIHYRPRDGSVTD
ncbi:transcription elongation factor [Saccharomycopsis crataegensis]|uniref:Transcription elongation factor SPT4 n=1 Tax=Saccharomycopsis crataegensis TaxID=43959 RepID=A0AAV5QRK3_9ASCO|nr:transcription elongation factor [Saccharomycopsis crataegensis]